MERFMDNKIYCRKLGHHVTFSYCQREQTDLPCSRIRECWGSSIAIDDWLSAHFAHDALARLDRPPESKMGSLISLIEKAKKTDTGGKTP